MKKTPLKALLNGLIDYAGLFPPAQVSVSQAVDNYDAYLGSADSWALGAFVVPVARLAEFEATAKNPLPLSIGVHRWWWLNTISAAQDMNFAANLTAELDHIDDFNRRHARDVFDERENKHYPGFIAVNIEVKINRVDEVWQLSRVFSKRDRHIGCYCEVPLDERMLPCLDAIAEAPMKPNTALLAKVRTGGLDADGFPSSASLLKFIVACHERDISFKATAGLHHPLRGTHSFTYEPDSARGTMHGFLNLFLAACFIRHGASETDVALLLDETSIDAIKFDEDEVTWCGARLRLDEIDVARRFAISFGSCSFTEPLDDLRALNLL